MHTESDIVQSYFDYNYESCNPMRTESDIVHNHILTLWVLQSHAFRIRYSPKSQTKIFMSPHYDLDLQDSKQIFLHNNQGAGDAAL